MLLFFLHFKVLKELRKHFPCFSQQNVFCDKLRLLLCVKCLLPILPILPICQFQPRSKRGNNSTVQPASPQANISVILYLFLYSIYFTNQEGGGLSELFVMAAIYRNIFNIFITFVIFILVKFIFLYFMTFLIPTSIQYSMQRY